MSASGRCHTIIIDEINIRVKGKHRTFSHMQNETKWVTWLIYNINNGDSEYCLAVDLWQ